LKHICVVVVIKAASVPGNRINSLLEPEYHLAPGIGVTIRISFGQFFVCTLLIPHPSFPPDAADHNLGTSVCYYIDGRAVGFDESVESRN
jgi:hypothetical protein